MPLPFRGLDLSSPLNRIRSGWASLALNVRTYLQSTILLRNLLSAPILTLSGAIQTILRLNDTTPGGPVTGYSIITAAGTSLFVQSTSVATGFSGNPISLIPFRPNTSVQPWAYTGDTSSAVTLTTKFAINNNPTTFVTNGMTKVRSDGLIYKAGIKEPQYQPVVGIQTTTQTIWLTLPANTPPWTNLSGQNPSQNYGGIDNQPPFPTIIPTPIAEATISLVVTGTATVNGATHAPGDAGPSTAGFPGAFITSPVIVVFAFTDGNGNILAQSGAVGAPPVVGNIGAGTSLTVPPGASQLQIGIDSQGGHFSANSGSFKIQAIISTSAVALNTALAGLVTAYVWGDSPHNGPVALYIWKNPNDVGTGIARTFQTANVTATNNSLIFDSTPEDGTVPVLWTTLDSTGASTGSINLFNPALETQGYQDFNAAITGSIFFPAAGVYNVQIQNKDQVMFGMGGGITSTNQPATGPFGQTVTVVSNLPLIYVSVPSGGGGAVTQSFTILVPALGVYNFECDWDYWFHTGRSLIIQMGATPGAAVATIPPLPQSVRQNVSYGYKYRSSPTGAQSNPSPQTSPQFTPVLANTLQSAYSTDPQVDKVDFYRQDSGLANFTYVATGPNDGQGGLINGILYNTPIVDQLSDLAAASNPLMTFDDFEPVPSIDTPKSGRVSIVAGVINWVSGDKFNTRWLPGTVILIGSPTQLAYTLIQRPLSTTQMVIPTVPDNIGDSAGDGVVYNIAEPILANQPLPYLFGPTDNINFAFGVGDPLRPGTLYWSKGNNLDSWPDTNQQDVTSPSEALVNGAMSSGLGVLFSILRAWLILPNFFNAQATVTGTAGSTWTLQDTSINRGLFIPRCVAVEGGGRIYFRVNDGIHTSMRGATSESITDIELYPLFPHEGSTPTAVTRNGVTFFPPDDTKPNAQKFSIINQFLYYDYQDTGGISRTIVFDNEVGGWFPDAYSPLAVARASNAGQSVQGVLVGCSDSTIRNMVSTGATEVASANLVTAGIGGTGFCHIGQITVEYSSNASATLLPIVIDTNNGSYYGGSTITLPSTAGIVQKLKLLPAPNKFKLMNFQFQWSDPTFQLYTEGFEVHLAAWGADYTPTNPFTEAGGYGGQVT